MRLADSGLMAVKPGSISRDAKLLGNFHDLTEHQAGDAFLNRGQPEIGPIDPIEPTDL